MKYVIGSGFFGGQEAQDFSEKYWVPMLNKLKHHPTIIGVGGCVPPMAGLILRGNLGHVHDLIHNKKPHEFCGWSASVCALALIAYNDESDFIYLEQDALAFGPWVEQMYADLGDGKMIFGRKMNSPPWMQCGQSLILIKHDFIPLFVSSYLSMGKDGDVHNLPERKFEKLEEKFGKRVIKRLSFGYDRERPINFDDKVFYAQKFTEQELAELKKRGMI